jgi:hypothetical protein
VVVPRHETHWLITEYGAAYLWGKPIRDRVLQTIGIAHPKYRKELLENNNLIKPAQLGRIVEGKVIGKGRSKVFFDLGPLGAGVIYGKEFLAAKNELKNLKNWRRFNGKNH